MDTQFLRERRDYATVDIARFTKSDEPERAVGDG